MRIWLPPSLRPHAGHRAPNPNSKFLINRNMKHLLTIIGCSALLASCSLYKNYERPESLTQGLDSLFRDTTSTYSVVKADTTNFGNTPWQEVFTDPQLQELINKALANNTNMRDADLTIQQAEAGLKVARLAYYPSLSLTPSGTASAWDWQKASKIYNIPATASWQLGSWGSLRNNRKQSEVGVEVSKAAKQATRTAIIASVANMYYTLQMLDEQLKTTEATVTIWTENVRAMEAMKKGGMTTEAAVAQSKANLYQLQASVPALRQSISQTENSLCSVLHEAPHPISRSAFNADNFPTSYSTGVALQLLSNRPDVRAAELQLASKFYGVNIARSAFYPSLTLTGSLGWTNSSGMGIVNPGKFLWSTVASLVQPLFQNGKLKANLKISKLELESAQLNFEQTLLDAGNEVSNALATYQSAAAQEILCQKQVDALASALDKTQVLFQHSTGTTYLEILTAQQSLVSAQLSLIQEKFDKIQAAITLYQALGGGREAE